MSKDNIINIGGKKPEFIEEFHTLCERHGIDGYVAGFFIGESINFTIDMSSEEVDINPLSVIGLLEKIKLHVLDDYFEA